MSASAPIFTAPAFRTLSLALRLALRRSARLVTLLAVSTASLAAPTGGTTAPAVPPASGHEAGKATAAAAQAALDAMKAGYKDLRAYFTDEEWKEVSQYMLDATVDTLKGTEEAVLSPELAFRLEILKKRLHRESQGYWQGFAEQWQQWLAPGPDVAYEPPPFTQWVPNPPPASTLPPPSR